MEVLKIRFKNWNFEELFDRNWSFKKLLENWSFKNQIQELEFLKINFERKWSFGNQSFEY